MNEAHFIQMTIYWSALVDNFSLALRTFIHNEFILQCEEISQFLQIFEKEIKYKKEAKTTYKHLEKIRENWINTVKNPNAGKIILNEKYDN